MEQIVRITCEGATTRDIDELQHFQGNLKDLSEANYNKLKKQIIELGFSEPVSVWIDESQSSMLLNGHQRVRVLLKMRSEGWLVPPIPINNVEAKDVKEARKKVLAFTSQYGNMTEEGLYEFMEDSGLNFDEVASVSVFPEIELGKFWEAYYGDIPKVAGEEGDNSVGGKEAEAEQNYNITYTLVFNSLEEQEYWFKFLQSLKNKYPDEKTLSERLIVFLKEKTGA